MPQVMLCTKEPKLWMPCCPALQDACWNPIGASHIVCVSTLLINHLGLACCSFSNIEQCCSALLSCLNFLVLMYETGNSSAFLLQAISD